MKKQHKNSILEDFQSNRFILMITSVKSLKQYQCYCARLSSDTKNKVNDGDERIQNFFQSMEILSYKTFNQILFIK